MLNYTVDPALLANRVPPGTELDRFDGQTFVSLVGFRFLRTRVLGVRVPSYETFDEVNLRFYVRRRRRTGACAIALRAHGDPTLPREGSLEEFITQHYWGYVLDRRGGTLEYGVRHDPRRVWPGNVAKFSGDGATFYGTDLARALNVAPQSSFLAEGSPIQVLSAQKLA